MADGQALKAVLGGVDERGGADRERALMLRHHSAVGLVDRAAAAGLVVRRPDEHNHSMIRLALTASGLEKPDRLTEAHVQELKQLAPAMRSLWRALQPAEL